MRLLRVDVTEIYHGLKGQKEFLHNMMAGLATEDIDVAIARNVQVEKIRKVLDIIESGLVYFEKNWLDAAGVPVKFKWWSIPQWKLMFKSIDFYGDMFADIADVYRVGTQNN